MDLGKALLWAFGLGIGVTLFVGGGLLEGVWDWARWLAAPVTGAISMVVGQFFIGREPKRPYICFVSLSGCVLVYATAP